MCFSQVNIYKKNLPVKNFKFLVPIRNNDTYEMSVTIWEKRMASSILFNSDYIEQKTLKYNFKNTRTYNNLINTSYYKNNYFLLFSDVQKLKYSLLNINYESDKINEAIIDLKIEDERFIASHQYNGTLYILNIPVGSSTINIYEFDSYGELSKRAIYFGRRYDFSEESGEKLYDKLRSNVIGSYNINIQQIINDYPQSVPSSNSTNKVYFSGYKCIITIDNYRYKTVLLEIDLKTKKYNVKEYLSPKLSCKAYKHNKSNSTIIDSLLFQVNVCKEELGLKITNINTDSVINAYYAKAYDLFDFKNSFYKIKKDNNNDYLELNLSTIEKIIKNLANNSIVIAVNNNNDGKYIIEIGNLLNKMPKIIPVPSGYIGSLYDFKAIVSIFDPENKEFPHFSVASIENEETRNFGKVIIKSSVEFLDFRDVFIYKGFFNKKRDEFLIYEKTIRFN